MHNSKKEIKKKTKSYFLKIIFSRWFIYLLAIISEIILLWKILIFLSDEWSIGTVLFLNLIIDIIIINSSYRNDDYRILLMMIVNLLPGVGILIYLILILQKKFSIVGKRLYKLNESTKNYNVSNYNYIKNNLEKEEAQSFLYYISNYAMFYPFIDNDIKYYESGKDYFEDAIFAMKNAKKYIFIESFLIYDGIIWQQMLDILKQKAKEGVEIKLLYDGLNIIGSFAIKYEKELKKYGIDAKMFMPVVPLLSTNQNNRDHRKFIIVDGDIAFTGGINIGDEYANLYKKFGIWKDAGVRVKGSSAKSFSLMFLIAWYLTEKKSKWNFTKYLPFNDFDNKEKEFDSYIAPYTDYPIDNENVSENLYKMMFNYSYDYLYVITPYLILDDSMLDTIIRARKRGVKVKIITPHIPDKKLIFYVTRSHYKKLLENDIEIYEYKDGFTHAKVVLQDDKRAMVTTANLDYRSLYLHYEDGLYIYNDKCIKDIKNDFDFLFKSCIMINSFNDIPLYQRILGKILKIFASQF